MRKNLKYRIGILEKQVQMLNEKITQINCEHDWDWVHIYGGDGTLCAYILNKDFYIRCKNCGKYLFFKDKEELLAAKNKWLHDEFVKIEKQIEELKKESN